MHYSELRQKLGDLPVFTSFDIKKHDPDFYYSRLTEWQNKNYIKKLVKGFYIFNDQEHNENDLFTIANRLYFPSYISLESAFGYYNLIPEGVFTITSITTKNTRKVNTEIASFSYRHQKQNLFFGYYMAKSNKIGFKIAYLEKALLDYFYLNTNISTLKDMQELRFNHESLKEQLNKDRLRNYLEIFSNNNLEKRIKCLI
ncbi:hypothetical protein COT52_01310 [candidate division WWE3 bacterium CG08_land_8_20_14_0_20_43_13]|uniref:Uncharacterized protein n=1 Tax=candidate division WWE3 bacterium CG08_land_8_20_14_0_20_43_13 TaxID=1975087 RepID=A0A2H0X7L5_UNCKA|nr:MAG: hypothetical protein COT52_01310 [candidate division WWE3 bacterium CG08_land_8_20_14_0_20_43_13]